jgi:hypothetical protein
MSKETRHKLSLMSRTCLREYQCSCPSLRVYFAYSIFPTLFLCCKPDWLTNLIFGREGRASPPKKGAAHKQEGILSRVRDATVSQHALSSPCHTSRKTARLAGYRCSNPHEGKSSGGVSGVSPKAEAERMCFCAETWWSSHQAKTACQLTAKGNCPLTGGAVGTPT